DAIDLVLADQGRQTREPVTGRSLFDDTERSCDGAGGVRDGNAGACPAEVECENLHFSAAAIACFPASSALRNPSGFLPPASPRPRRLLRCACRARAPAWTRRGRGRRATRRG